MSEEHRTKTISQDSARDWAGAAAKTLSRGGLVAFPTETFYGIGADPFNKAALQRLFTLKTRHASKPVPLIIKDMEMLLSLVERVPLTAQRLIERFWPGPLTIIFNARETVPAEATGGSGSIGLRISSGAACKRLLHELNSPVTATSANTAGKPPARSAAEVLEYFNGRVDLVIDGGRLEGACPSTVVDVTGEGVEVLREGAVPSRDIFDALR